MQAECVEVNGNKYLVKVHYEEDNSSRVSIGKKTINIRIPSFLNRNERFRDLLRMKMWAINKLKESPERFKPEPVKEYKHGEVLKVGNEEYTLKIELKVFV